LLLSARYKLWLRQRAIAPLLAVFERPLFLLAGLWRRVLPATFVAVGGSVGKTTGKELIATVLAVKGRTYRSIANQNGGIVVPLNVLRVRPWHRFAVIESAIGIDDSTSERSWLIRPDIGVMLAVRRTHTDVYPTLEATAAEKVKLFDHLAPGGVGCLNGDDERVAQMAELVPGRVRMHGTTPGFDLWAEDVEAKFPQRLRFTARTVDESVPVQTQLAGAHWLSSVLAALAVGLEAGVSLADAARAIESVEPFRARMQPVRLPNGVVFLRDDYQASIDVSDAAFKVLEEAKATRKILVATDISDYDKSSQNRRKYLAAAAARVSDVAVFIGRKASYGVRRAVEAGMAEGAALAFDDLFAAADYLKGELRDGDLVLLKGRVTDHVSRLFYAQFAEVECRLKHCPKTMLCDECWELGVSEEASAMLAAAQQRR